MMMITLFTMIEYSNVRVACLFHSIGCSTPLTRKELKVKLYDLQSTDMIGKHDLGYNLHLIGKQPERFGQPTDNHNGDENYDDEEEDEKDTDDDDGPRMVWSLLEDNLLISFNDIVWWSTNLYQGHLASQTVHHMQLLAEKMAKVQQIKVFVLIIIINILIDSSLSSL